MGFRAIRRPWSILLVAALAVLVASACTSGEDASSTADTAVDSAVMTVAPSQDTTPSPTDTTSPPRPSTPPRPAPTKAPDTTTRNPLLENPTKSDPQPPPNAPVVPRSPDE